MSRRRSYAHDAIIGPLTGSGINPKIEVVEDRRFLHFVCKQECCQVWFRDYKYTLMTRFTTILLLSAACAIAPSAPVRAQSSTEPTTSTPAAHAAPASNPATAADNAPPDFVIGPGDVLTVVFWREKELSTDVIVRPDGLISLPLLNDVRAAGLTPELLRQSLIKIADRYIEDPNATVVVKEINSRRVFITGQVAKPGSYSLMAPMTVVQLISIAGGLLEYADKENILVIHTDKRQDGQPLSDRVNYSEMLKGKNLKQNIGLKSGDTVVVP